MLRGWTLALAGVLAAAVWLGAPAPSASADHINRFYHYPYTYYPHSYAPRYYRWPDPRQHFQPAPPYMAYPPYLDPNFRHDLFEHKWYHRGTHFFLDQF